MIQARARLIALDKQIELTERSVNAQKYNAESVSAAVERVRALAKQTSDTLRRTEPLLAQGYASAEEVDRARTAQRSAQADLNATLLQAGKLPQPLAVLMRWWRKKPWCRRRLPLPS